MTTSTGSGARLTFLQQIDSSRDWSAELSKGKADLLNAAKAASGDTPILGRMTSTALPVRAHYSSKSKRKKEKKRLKKAKGPPGVVNRIDTTDVPTVVFNDPANSTAATASDEQKPASTTKRGADTDEGPELDLKKAKFDIIKFGFNSMKGLAKEDAETAFAISLGAKPPKKSFVNYKDLQESNKQEKIQKAEEEAGRAKQPRFTLKKGDRLKNRSQSQKSPSHKVKAKVPNSNANVKHKGQQRLTNMNFTRKSKK